MTWAVLPEVAYCLKHTSELFDCAITTLNSRCELPRVEVNGRISGELMISVDKVLFFFRAAVLFFKKV